MGARRFLVGMLVVLSIVSVVIYARTGSLLWAVVDVAISAVILQVGYVAYMIILPMVLKRGPFAVAARSDGSAEPQQPTLAIVAPSDLQPH